MSPRFFILLLTTILLSFTGDSQIITTAVGGGSGAGYLATSSVYAGRFTFDTSGNMYVISNSRILKVNTGGMVSTIAGNGIDAYSGDGGPATAAGIYDPKYIVADKFGNVYFSEMAGNRIRKINTAGNISTIAGSTAGASGLSGDGGPATAALLRNPGALAVDTNGNVYFVDEWYATVRKINVTTGIITLVAGSGISWGYDVMATTVTMHQIFGVAVDRNMNVYITSYTHDRVMKVDPSGMLTVVAGNDITGFSGDGGPATAARLNSPTSIYVNSAGTILFSDMDNNRIRTISTTGIINTVAGNGLVGGSPDGTMATSAMVADIWCVHLSNTGVITFYDPPSGTRIRKINSTGTLATLMGGYMISGASATDAQLYAPAGLAIDRHGNMYMSDVAIGVVRKINAAGTISLAAGSGPAVSYYEGGYGGDGGPATAALLDRPMGVAVDTFDNLFIADYANARIRKVNSAGTISTFAGTGTAGYNGDTLAATATQISYVSAIASDGANIYISDYWNCRVRKVTPTGVVSTVAGTGTCGFSGEGGPATAANIGYPTGLCLDPAGNLLVSFPGDNIIRKVTPGGIISIIAGDGTSSATGDGGPATAATLLGPSFITCDKVGNVYINSGTNKVRRINPAGIISTYAGDGTDTYLGDGGLALASSLRRPEGMATDAARNLYICDREHSRVRKVSFNHEPFFVAPGAVTKNICPGMVLLDSALATIDSSIAQTITWTVVTPPAHGIVAGTYTATSTGGWVMPSLSYTHSGSYIGPDNIVMAVSDGYKTDTISLNFMLYQLPAVATISGAGEVCVGETVTLTNATPGGMWSTTGTNASVDATGVVTGLAAGGASVSYSVTNLCGVTTVAHSVAVVDCPDGINDTREVQVRLLATPNPNDGNFSLLVQTPAYQTVEVMITDVAGKQIQAFSTTTNTSHKITLNEPAGIYFLSVTAASYAKVMKLVIQK